MENINEIVEAVLFALGRDISLDELSRVLKVDIANIEKAVIYLEEKYNKNSAITFVKVQDSVQLVTNSKYYEYVNLFVENTKRQNLSPAAIETLTIIAYNPKITKTEIEKIRGVSSDFAVGRLLECGLVEEIARLNLPGRPAIYSVTKEFLKNCGIKSVEELPNFNEIKLKDEQLMINDIEETSNEENEVEKIAEEKQE
ncbi:MAG: SMC-Scp complex subunit ScpB [Clostridia bacterium]